MVNTSVEGFDGESVALACIYSGRAHARRAATLVLITSREPDERLYRELVGEDGEPEALRIQRIGDCRQPATIAHAVYAGHKAARQLDEVATTWPPRRDRALV